MTLLQHFLGPSRKLIAHVYCRLSVEVPTYPGMKLTIAQQVISIKVWTEEFPQPIVDPNDNTNLMCPNCRRSTKTKQRFVYHLLLLKLNFEAALFYSAIVAGTHVSDSYCVKN